MRHYLLLFRVGSLLAVLLNGCVDKGYASQESSGAPVGEQTAAGLTPSPGALDSTKQNATSRPADQPPPILGSAPSARLIGGWQRHRFFDVWEIGYPDARTVERLGTGQAVFKGAYGEHQYKVEVARPTDVETKDLAAWAQADLAKINQARAPRVEAPIKNLPALKVTNLKLPGQSEGACPAVRVYARTDRLTGGQDYLAMTVTQADKSPCDETNAKRLADALITEVGT